MTLPTLAKVAVVCPGQGILPRGCLHEFRHLQPLFQQTLNCIDDVLQQKFSCHLLDEPLASIDAWGLSTANAQPAIVAATYAICEVLRKAHGVDLATHPRVSYLLGHSLGEYTALLLSGVLRLEDTIAVVRRRGQLMEELVGLQKYEMWSLLFKPALYELVYEAAALRGVLACANNATTMAISGTPLELAALVRDLNAEKKTILRQAKLPVSVPFHSRLLQKIEPELLSWGNQAHAAGKPIVSNLTGDESDDVFASAVKATSQPVLWRKSIDFLQKNGVDALVNLGPGNAVSSINSRFALANVSAASPSDLEALASSMRQ